MVIEIQDQRFLTEFYRDHCRRSVHGKVNQDAIARKHVEVGWLPDYGQQLEINICEGLGNSTIDLGWDPVEGAWPIYYSSADAALHTCNRVALTACVRRLLLKHDVTDIKGIFIKRGAA
jgi:hypothetical protein